MALKVNFMGKVVNYLRVVILVLLSNCVCGQKIPSILKVDSNCNTKNSLAYFHALGSQDSICPLSGLDSFDILLKFEKCILMEDSISMMSATSVEIDVWLYNFAISNEIFLKKIDSFPNIATHITYYIGNEIENLVQIPFEFKQTSYKFASVYLGSKKISQEEFNYTKSWFIILNK
jgi:hypothetical protein